MESVLESRAPFVRLLLASFQYPLRGDGPYLIAGGGVFFWAADCVSAYVSIFALLIHAVISSFLVLYAKNVVQTGAMGEDLPPAWCVFSNWVDDLLVPLFQLFMVLALSFGLVIVIQFHPPSSPSMETGLRIAGGVWGCLVFPIIFLAVAVTDSVSSLLNPIPLLRAVWLMRGNYLLACIFTAVIIALGIGASALENWVVRIPVLPHLAGWWMTLYLVMVLMRSFGVLYWHHRVRLQWY